MNSWKFCASGRKIIVPTTKKTAFNLHFGLEICYYKLPTRAEDIRLWLEVAVKRGMHCEIQKCATERHGMYLVA